MAAAVLVGVHARPLRKRAHELNVKAPLRAGVDTINMATGVRVMNTNSR